MSKNPNKQKYKQTHIQTQALMNKIKQKIQYLTDINILGFQPC